MRKHLKICNFFVVFEAVSLFLHGNRLVAY